jgi:uncharacterized protein involved in exopolysaccharide biosynthesis
MNDLDPNELVLLLAAVVGLLIGCVIAAFLMWLVKL